MKKLRRYVGVIICAALCVSSFALNAQAKAKKYVKSLSVKSRATITIPAEKKTAVKTYKVTVKVKGKVWEKYLSGKSFSDSAARLYIYSGNNDFIEQLQYKATAPMENRLKAAGYPDDKIKTVLDENAVHSESFWAIYFPEMLSFGLQIK